MNQNISNNGVKGLVLGVLAVCFVVGFIACDGGSTPDKFKANLKIKVSSVDPKIAITKNKKYLPKLSINKTIIKFKNWGDVDLEDMDIRKDYMISAKVINTVRNGNNLSCDADDIHIPANTLIKGEMYAVNVEYKCVADKKR
jgi:hypothetical protein